ncbi:TcpQ domain-containing protein [Bordetella genomosp. 1]|nr:TcpQ domain-containing protein [Bordetella genomosp. 1]
MSAVAAPPRQRSRPGRQLAFLASMASCVLLPGCGLTLREHGWAVAGDAARNAWQAPPAAYDFDWRLSGDADAGPVQMFGDGAEIWLQFAPGQPVPALFARTAAGLSPLPYQQYPPYVVVRSDARELVLRAGHLEARARHAPMPTAETRPAQATHVAAAPIPIPAPPPAPPSARAALPASPPAASHSRAAVSGPMAAAVAQPSARVPAIVPYRAAAPDATLRAVLARWAERAGWTFHPAHWAVDADIPLDGAAVFGSDFKQAVRDLLASTELSDRPVQPCFYANQVLRVVPLAAACDRSRPFTQAGA